MHLPADRDKKTTVVGISMRIRIRSQLESGLGLKLWLH